MRIPYHIGYIEMASLFPQYVFLHVFQNYLSTGNPCHNSYTDMFSPLFLSSDGFQDNFSLGKPCGIGCIYKVLHQRGYWDVFKDHFFSVSHIAIAALVRFAIAYGFCILWALR